MADGWQSAVVGLQTEIDTANSQISALSGQVSSQLATISSLQAETSALQAEVLALEQGSPVSGIVAKNSFLGQSSALAETPLFTSTNGGEYRVSGYLVAHDSLGVAAGFSWNDGVRDENPSTAPPVEFFANVGFGWQSVFLHVAAGKTISVFTQISGTPIYDLYTVVEELSTP